MEKESSHSAKHAYPTISPYLVVNGAANLIDFLKKAFDAQEVFRELRPDGHVMHAEMRIGDSIIMISDASSEHYAMPTMLYLYLDEVDRFYQRAIDAGATSIMEPKDQEYGHRSGGVKDLWDNQWWIASAIKKPGMVL